MISSDVISSQLIFNIEASLRDDALKGVFNPQRLLDHLQSAGFAGARFYDAVSDPITNNQYLCLSNFVTEPKYRSDYLAKLGSFIDFEETVVGQRGSAAKLVIRSPEEDVVSSKLREYNKALHLCNDTLIQIPIRSSGNLIGELSCSWRGNPSDICQNVQYSLKLIASILGRTWRFAKNEAIQNSMETVEANLSAYNGSDLSEFICKICSEMRALSNGKLAALFEFDCYTNQVRKIYECGSINTKFAEHVEEYFVGETLTGRAFEDENSRYVANFDEVLKRKSSLINKDAEKIHSEALGGIKTVLYQKFGEREDSYLLRLMNRNDQDELPFTLFHREVLAGVMSKVSKLLDDKVSSIGLSNFQSFSTGVLANVTDVGTAVNEVQKRLAGENVDDLIFIATSLKERYCRHVHLAGGLSDLYFSQHRITVELPIIGQALSINELGYIDLSLAKFEDCYFSEKLREKGFNFVLVVRCHTDDLNGFMLIPKAIEKRHLSPILTRLSKLRIANLSAFAANLIHVAKSSDSLLTAGNALKLIGHIGHEIENPVSVIGHGAIKIVNQALHTFESRPELISNLGDDAETLISGWTIAHDDIARSLESLPVQLDVAVDMALFTESNVEVTFEAFLLNNLLSDVAERVEDEVDVLQGDRGYTCKFVLNERATKDTFMVGDEQLVEKVVTHIFRNALKYSIPRYAGEPINIEVNYIPQNVWHIIEVVNWGTPIAKEMREIIRRPFQRGAVYDRKWSRKGMGLGLYLADQFAKVHGGEVFCSDSTPMLNDPQRRMTEGWLTKFEIRIKKGLSPGVASVQLSHS